MGGVPAHETAIIGAQFGSERGGEGDVAEVGPALGELEGDELGGGSGGQEANGFKRGKAGGGGLAGLDSGGQGALGPVSLTMSGGERRQGGGDEEGLDLHGGDLGESGLEKFVGEEKVGRKKGEMGLG